MKYLRNFFIGIDMFLLLILVGKNAENAMQQVIAKSVESQRNLPVMQVENNVQETEENIEQIDMSRIDQTEKKIAITFDDGPNPEYTETLLTGLKERGVKATFFLLGAQAEKYPEIVKEIYEGEHLIGTHSYEHIDLKKLCDADAIAQVDKTNKIIQEITGENPEYIRPPYGSWKSNLDYETSMIEVLWDIDPRDWATDNADAVVNCVVGKVQENDVILLHDASESSVQAAFRIIDELKKEGYVFVTVDEILFD